jgi:hypothetical protein
MAWRESNYISACNIWSFEKSRFSANVSSVWWLMSPTHRTSNSLTLDFIKILCLIENRLVWPSLAEHIKGKESCTILIFTRLYFFHHSWSYSSPLPPFQILFLSLQKIKIITFGCIVRMNYTRYFLFAFFSNMCDRKHRLK